MNEEVERRFREAFEKVGLLKEGQAETLELDQDPPTVVEEASAGKETKDVHLRARPRPMTVINLFQHPDSHPYVLDLALLKEYGPEWMEWEVDTLRLRIPNDFPTNSVSDLNIEKIQAAKTLHYVDTYWQDWQVFLPCTMALNGLYPDFNVMQVPTVAQCAVSVDIASRVRSDVPWSEEVIRYLEAAHRFDGILCPFAPLEFVEVDTEGLPIDCGEIRERWPAVRKTRQAPTEETVTAEQLRRMLVIQEAVEEDRDRLQAQLPLLFHA